MPLGTIREADFRNGRWAIEFEGRLIPFSWKDVANRSMKGLEPGVQVLFTLLERGDASRAVAVRRFPSAGAAS